MSAASKPLIVLAAGGTGGHMFPAEALAGALLARGFAVALVTDRRGGGFAERLPAVVTHRISAAGLMGGGALGRAQALAKLGLGFLQARRLLADLRPAAAVGFGGYASVPTIAAAMLVRVPVLLHEQNAVLGRANRLLARRARALAVSFAAEAMRGLPDGVPTVFTGNPVRAAIVAIAQTPYAAPAPGQPFELLVTGGSQGARVFGRVVPEAIALLPAEAQSRLKLAQQCRTEDVEVARTRYARLGLTAELSPFFTDMAQRLSTAHLVIARAGASTVAEFAAAARPAILVPYPFAADDHQTANAAAYAATGAATLMPERDFTPAALCDRLALALHDPARLVAAAKAAAGFARRDAAERLVDAVAAIVAADRPREEAA